MRLGLVGLPQVGKRTLFHLLTDTRSDEDRERGSARGMAHVRDVRFDQLVEIYRPRAATPHQIEVLLLPDLDSQASRNGDAFKALEQVDVICHVVRAFDDDSVFHLRGSVDPARDIRGLDEELALYDLLFVEKRLERIEKDRLRKHDVQKAELETGMLERMRDHLVAAGLLRSLSLSPEEQKIVSGYPPLLTRKALVVVLNVGEQALRDAEALRSPAGRSPEVDSRVMAVSVRIEHELSLLAEEDRGPFLEEFHLSQPALDRLALFCFRSLGLISFFTVGPDEVRAWAAHEGSHAPEAGHAIHTDIERGFIRAEVIRCEDLIELGSEHRVREAGKLMMKGKDYVVQDGDVINFLFGV